MNLLRPSACLALVVAITTHAQAGFVLQQTDVNSDFSSDSFPLRGLAYDPLTGDLLTANILPDPNYDGDNVNPGLPGTLEVRQRSFHSTANGPGSTLLFRFAMTDLSAEVIKVLPNGHLLMLRGDAELVEVDRAGNVVTGGVNVLLAGDPPLEAMAADSVVDVAVNHTTGDIYATTITTLGAGRVRQFTSDGMQIWLLPLHEAPEVGGEMAVAFDSLRDELLVAGELLLRLDAQGNILQAIDHAIGVPFLNSNELMDIDAAGRRLFIVEHSGQLRELQLIPEPLTLYTAIVAGALYMRRRISERRAERSAAR